MNVLAVVIKSTGITSPVKLCSLESVGACGSVKEGKIDGACCCIRHCKDLVKRCGAYTWPMLAANNMLEIFF